MSNPKHTPGPWSYLEDPGRMTVHERNLLEVCTVLQDENCNWRQDTRLITAAPELADLARLALEPCGGMGKWPSHSELLGEIRLRASALLARIDGEDT